MRRRKNRWILPAAAVGGIVGIALLVWLGLRVWPFFVDWVLYPDVDSQCGGALHYSGPDAGDGRHCYLGPETHQTESGFRLATEFASGGWLVAYGHDQLNMRGQPNALHATIFHPAGKKAPWYCAPKGTIWREDGARFELENVSEIIPKGTEGDQTLVLKVTASGKIVEGKIGDRDIGSGQIWGHTCLQDERRCSINLGHENNLVRISVRTWIGMRTADHREIPIEEVFVTLEEGRSPHHLEIATAGSGGGSTVAWASDSNLLTLKINGLTALASCPPTAPGKGTLKGEFNP